ncbi:hypothetical protein C0993_000334 [Termitomyces sp. T159_Od127]|nr:hypothetical protein C0993_000334 [Termitomyces sp. T159_Od127]
MRTRKAKAALTCVATFTPTQATDIHVSCGEGPEAYNLASVSNDVVEPASAVVPYDQYPVPSDNGVGLGFAAAPVDQYIPTDSGVVLGSTLASSDQHAVASDNVVALSPAMTSNDEYTNTISEHTYNDPVFSSDTSNMMINHEAQLQPINYYGQPYHPYPSHIAMQPFSASEVDGYQTAELNSQMQGGDTVVYGGQLYAGDGLAQPPNTYGANYAYEHTTEFDVAAVPTGAYPITYFQNEANSGYAEYHDTGSTNADATGHGHSHHNAHFNANGIADPVAASENFAEFMGMDQQLRLALDTVSALVAASYAMA